MNGVRAVATDVGSDARAASAPASRTEVSATSRGCAAFARSPRCAATGRLIDPIEPTEFPNFFTAAGCESDELERALDGFVGEERRDEPESDQAQDEGDVGDPFELGRDRVLASIAHRELRRGRAHEEQERRQRCILVDVARTDARFEDLHQPDEGRADANHRSCARQNMLWERACSDNVPSRCVTVLAALGPLPCVASVGLAEFPSGLRLRVLRHRRWGIERAGRAVGDTRCKRSDGTTVFPVPRPMRDAE